MVIDTSAIVAILWSELDATLYAEAIASEEHCFLSAATYVELGVVAARTRRPDAAADVDELIEDGEIRIEPLTVVQARIARDAYARHGRGSGSPAKLNFGDCFAYALARDLGEPLLFKGDDFTHTDIEPVL